jgi:hypothetical protein
MSDLKYEDFDHSIPFILDTSHIIQLLSGIYGKSYQDIVRNIDNISNPYEKERHLYILFLNHFDEITISDIQHHLHDVIHSIWIIHYDKDTVLPYLENLFTEQTIIEVFEKINKITMNMDDLDKFQLFKHYIYSLIEKKIKKHFI